MKCTICQALIKNYYTTLENIASDPELEAHINNCSACQAQLAEEKKLDQVLASMPSVTPSSELQHKVWQTIAMRQNQSKLSLPTWLNPKLAWSLAGVLLLSLGLSSLIIEQEDRSRQSHVKTTSSTIISNNSEQDHELMDTNTVVKKPMDSQQLDFKQEKEIQVVVGNNINNQEITEKNAKIREYSRPRIISRYIKREKSSKLSKPVSNQKVAIVRNNEPSTQSVSEQPLKSSNVQALDITPLPLTGPAQGLKLYKNKINVNRGEATRITLSIDRASKITIIIYSRLGRVIKTITDSTLDSGYYEWQWSGKDQSNELVGTGIYLMMFKMDDQKPKKHKIIVIK